MNKSKENPLGEPSPTTSRLSLKDDSPLREWLSHLLSKYIRNCLFTKRDSPVTSEISLLDGNGNTDEGQGETVSSSGPFRRTSNANNEGEDVMETNLKTMISVEELEMIEETAIGDDRITYLSRILSIAASFSISDDPDNFTQWIVKVPSRHFDERSLARMTNAYQREVKFYAEILPNIKLWLELNPIPSRDGGDSEITTLHIPLCFYAVAQKSSLNSSCKAYDFPNSEFTLILDDLRAQGFGKRHYGIGLSVLEAKEAIREIVKIHTISWAMTEHSHDKALTWSYLLKWENLYFIHLDLIQQGFKHLRFLRSRLPQKKERMGLLNDLLELEPKLPSLLKELLRPLPSPGVTALVHMDFWTDNLLFRENYHEEDEEEEESTPVEKTEASDADPAKNDTPDPCELDVDNIDIDCMILDWQMISLGRITHDLGILMITSLDGRVRRKYDMELIKLYYDTFENIASLYKLEIPFDIEDLINQYKDSCLLAVLMTVGRFDLVTSEQSTMDRFFAALEDLKIDELI